MCARYRAAAEALLVLCTAARCVVIGVLIVNRIRLPSVQHSLRSVSAPLLMQEQSRFSTI